MIQKITTKSGSIYRLWNGRCSKNDNIMFTLIKEPYCIDYDDLKNAESWNDIFSAPKHPIQVGMALYVHGKDEWWVSTPIVSIEETEDEY